MQLFNLFLTYMIVALATASLGATFHYFLKPNMIFNFYAVWLSKLSNKSKFWKYWSMPLGLCPYCNTTWVAVVVFIYYFGISLPILLFIGLVWLFLHLILKTYNHE